MAQLKIALDLPGAIPCWAAAPDSLPQDSCTTLAIMTCGSARMQGPGLQGSGVRWLDGHHAHPYAWEQSVFGDFKAICRYLRHHTLGKARGWIARFIRASNTLAIEALLNTGGEEARRAWPVLIWWQICIQDLRLENWWAAMAFRWSGVPGVLALIDPCDRCQEGKSGLAGASAAQEWIARWVSAIGLVDIWRPATQTAALDSAPCLAMIGKGLSGAPCQIGARASAETTGWWFASTIQKTSCWRTIARLDKSARQARSRTGVSQRLEHVRAACAPPCLWFHGDTCGWTSGPGPLPAKLPDAKKHRLLPAACKLWFAVFAWTQAPCASRAFVARCLDLALAATGPSPSQAVRQLKHAVKRYRVVQRANPSA